MRPPSVSGVQSSVLNSWKEIAAYLGRGVRTVQRWEHDSGLPVHRPKGKDRSAVLALREELDEWLHRTAVRANGNGNGTARVASDIAPVVLELARDLLAHGERLANLDQQHRPEARKLVLALGEIVRELTVVVAGAAAPPLVPKRDKQQQPSVRRTG
jgi:excisionase family DNA binding protein